MSILDRYITQEFLKTFLFGIVALILVSTVVDIFERVDDIVQNKPPLPVSITFFIARIPQVLFMITPISVLLTTLLVIGSFAKNSEVIAMLASGVSIYRILVPLLIIGFIMSACMLGLNEFVVPTANRITEECKRIIKGKPDKSKMAKIQIWFRGKREDKNEAVHALQENRIYYINALIPDRLELHGVTIFELNTQFAPVRRIDAARAVYHPPSQSQLQNSRPQLSLFTRLVRFFTASFQRLIRFFHSSEEQENGSLALGTWTLYQGNERSLDMSAEKHTIITFRERGDYIIPRTFGEFRRDTKDPEDMNYQELTEYIKTLTASGYDVSEYIVDLRAKFSYPFVSLVMVIIGFPFALKSPRSGAAMGVGLSVFIGLTYWIILQLGISLGHARILPPTLAAWISHIMFASSGLYQILSTKT